MKTNLLIALNNIVNNPIADLITHYKSSNRANQMGEALENYVKDIFCHSVYDNNNYTHNEIFSYLGNQNNPPDIIIRNGDAIEVKKIESISSALALNSYYPKDKLHYDDSRITDFCRQCDLPSTWQTKDILYIIGIVKNKTRLNHLFFVYGDCYAADKSIYQRIANKMSQGIQEIPDIEFIETNELAKVKKVDPLGITDLRVRGMWHIINPFKVFSQFIEEQSSSFTIHAILLKEKYNSFPSKDIDNLEALQYNKNITIKDIKIKSPNNPAQLLDAKLISYAQ